MKGHKKHYDTTIKIRAVRMYQTGTPSELVAAKVGVEEATVRRWIGQLGECLAELCASPDLGQAQSRIQEMEARIKRLSEENAALKMSLSILIRPE